MDKFKKRFTDKQMIFIRETYNEYKEYMTDLEKGVYASALRFKSATEKQRETMKHAYIQCVLSKYPEKVDS
jgi:hypothetical protein